MQAQDLGMMISSGCAHIGAPRQAPPLLGRLHTSARLRSARQSNKTSKSHHHKASGVLSRAVASPPASQVARAFQDKPALLVRPAKTEDIHHIVDLTRELARETEDLELPLQQVTAGVHALISDPSKGRAYVIEAAGRVVAQMQIIYEWSDWRNTRMWWITSVFVDSEHRRQGCFKKLYDYARTAAIEERVAGIRVYTVNDNIAAQDTYAAMGMDCHHKVFQEDL